MLFRSILTMQHVQWRRWRALFDAEFFNTGTPPSFDSLLNIPDIFHIHLYKRFRDSPESNFVLVFWFQPAKVNASFCSVKCHLRQKAPCCCGRRRTVTRPSRRVCSLHLEVHLSNSLRLICSAVNPLKYLHIFVIRECSNMIRSPLCGSATSRSPTAL